MPNRRGISNWQEGGEDAGADLGSLVQRLRGEVEELLEAFDTMPARLTELDSRLREIGRAMRELETLAAQQDSSMRETSAVVKRLDARVEWLERNIRLQAGADEAALDDIGPEEIRLATIAEAGHQAQFGLLTVPARSGLEAAVQAHATAVRAHLSYRDQAIEACQTLATTPWQGERHLDAAARFREASAEIGSVRESIKRLAGPALQASQQLSGDEDRHRAVADVLAEGEQAWAELDHLLRARLADAVGSGALLPSWFTGVLGPIPPAQDTRRWMDAATALLAYRVSYAVTDPILALGPRPEPDAGPRQRSWYDQLTRQLRDLQT